MSNTPSKAEIEALVKRHGATSYRNRADTQHPAYGFTEDGLNGLIDEVLEKWGTPQPVAQEPVAYVEVSQSDAEVSMTWGPEPAGFNLPTGRYALYTSPQPAPAAVAGEPYGYVYTVQVAPIVGDERKVERTVFTRNKPTCKALPLYTQPQAGAVPLTDEQIEALPLWKRFVGLWPETRREIVRTIEHHHGIKGGQHGAE